MFPKKEKNNETVKFVIIKTKPVYRRGERESEWGQLARDSV